MLAVAEAYGRGPVRASVDNIDSITGPGGLERSHLAPRRGVDRHEQTRARLEVVFTGQPQLVFGHGLAQESEQLDERNRRIVLGALVPWELPPHDLLEVSDEAL